MLVSWNWLKEYVSLDMSPAELSDRLMMAGLNHESTTPVGSDWAIDLEITSNRADCLGHLGVAREVAALWNRPLQTPTAQPKSGATAATSLTSVTLQCPQLCYHYTARVLRNVKVGPSPAWLANRLQTIGIAVVNNIVDITNYVLMESGQPLHAFDLARLRGRKLIVREARAGEPFVAIDHKTYTLEPGMCVIADADRPVALGGVMGGVDSEVSSATTEVLVESANFSPLAIRTTARKLNLHSPSSYRFERGVDPAGLDWASRRCCELILNLAGGELASGVIAVGREIPARPPVVLRLSQLQRILGIGIPAEKVRQILTALGCAEVQADAQSVTTMAPSWRRDLTREIDLVEEVARIHGYDAIPEDAHVPMVPSHRTDHDRVQAKVRHVLTAAGFDEAMTISLVRPELAATFSPWTDADAFHCQSAILRGANQLRRSLIPSLLEVRQTNESLHNPRCELFETARVYLPSSGALPNEQWTLAVASSADYHHVKGVVEAMVATVNPAAKLDVVATRQPLLNPNRAGELQLNGRRFGWIGEVTAAGLKQFSLRADTTVAELNLAALLEVARLIPQYVEQSPYPAIARDLNLIVDEAIRWSDLAATVRTAVGPNLERLDFQETYRDPTKDGPGKKRLLFSIVVRSHERTLTNDEADLIRIAVVAAAQEKHGAALLG